MQVYGTSKLYNIMVAKALNERLKGTGVEAFSAHPGKCFRNILSSSVLLVRDFCCRQSSLPSVMYNSPERNVAAKEVRGWLVNGERQDK